MPQPISQIAGLAQRIRNSSALRSQAWLWNLARGPYRAAVRALAGSKGLKVCVNRADEFFLAGVYSRDLDYEAEVWNRIREAIEPEMRIYDVGAFQGVYTLLFASKVGAKGEIIALEPNPLARARLTRNLASNGLNENVQVIPAICGDQSGRMTLRYVPTDDFFRSGFSSVVGGIAELERTQPLEAECEVTTLDVLTRDHGFPDLLKIDVEGFERKVLRGGEKMLAENRPIIFCEIHPDKMRLIGDDPNELVGWLTTMDYLPEFMDGTPVETIPDEGTWNVVFRPRE